jgi:hypothetical protein
MLIKYTVTIENVSYQDERHARKRSKPWDVFNRFNTSVSSLRVIPCHFAASRILRIWLCGQSRSAPKKGNSTPQRPGVARTYQIVQNLVLGQKTWNFALQFDFADVSFGSNLEPIGGEMSDAADRREARRFNMTLPLRVLPHEAQHSELNAQTRDVSYRGLYFHAAAKFEIGSEIEFVITLPQQVTQATDVNIRCLGHIVRVEPTSNGRVGIAAKIDRYEFMPAAANAA